jgi:polygalacturonase
VPEPTVLDVTEFGAVGDGVANDARAVLVDSVFPDFGGFGKSEPRFDPAAGAILHLPAGTYRIGALPDWPHRYSFPFSRFHIRGDGRGTTTIVLDQQEYPRGRVSVHGGPEHGRVTDVSVSGLTIRTTVPSPGDRSSGEMCLHFREVDGLVVEDVEICAAPQMGLHVNSCTDVVIRGCHVHDVCLDGIHVDGCAQAVIEDNLVTDTGDDGIGLTGENEFNPQPSRRVTIRGNRIHRAGSNGIAIMSARGVLVEGNEVDGTYQVGIGVRAFHGQGSIHDVTIRKNLIDHAGFHETGVLWGGGTASGLAVIDDDDVGVDLSGVVIEGNQLGRTRNSFVRIRGASNVVVRDNHFVGPLVPGPSANPGSGHGSASNDPGVYDPIHVSESADVVIDPPHPQDASPR